MNHFNMMMADIEKIRRQCFGKGIKWNKYRGDAFERIVADYLRKNLPTYVSVERSGYYSGYPTEYDIMIVKKNSLRIGLTGAFSEDDILGVIELKGSGVFYKKDDIQIIMKSRFKDYESDHTQPLFFVSLWETGNNKTEMVKAIGEKGYFFQIDKNEPEYTEWNRLVSDLKKICK
jgi:hypothetical protein